MATPEVDWTPHLEYSENTITCRCGQVYRSHSKYVSSLGTIVTQKPCPSCQKTFGHVRRASSDPETYTL